jgi:hypothetical protein
MGWRFGFGGKLGKKNIEAISKVLQKLLTLPSLEKLRFNADSTPTFRYSQTPQMGMAWMAAVLERDPQFRERGELGGGVEKLSVELEMHYC